MNAFINDLDRDYTRVPNSIFRLKLSAKAVGLFCYMASKTNNWKFSLDRIANNFKEGISGVRTGIAELEECGALTREINYQDGKLCGYTYILRNPKKQSSENQTTENQTTENLHAISKTENSKTDRSKTDGSTPPNPQGGECPGDDLSLPSNRNDYSKGFESFWTAYPRRNGVKSGKAPAYKIWQRKKLEPRAEEITRAVTRASLTEDWSKDNGRFIPMATTYLNQERWNDEIDDFDSSPFAATDSDEDFDPRFG